MVAREVGASAVFSSQGGTSYGTFPPVLDHNDGRKFTLREIWSESRLVLHFEPVALIGRQRRGLEVATAFVLKDDLHLELDIHAVRFDRTRLWNSRRQLESTTLSSTRIRCRGHRATVARDAV